MTLKINKKEDDNFESVCFMFIGGSCSIRIRAHIISGNSCWEKMINISVTKNWTQ